MDIIAFFTNSGIPAAGLSPTIRIRRVSTGALLVTDAAMTEIGDGFYKYNFAAYDPTIDYAIRCDGGIILSGSERYTYAGNENSEVLTEIETVNTNVLGVSANSDTTSLQADILRIGTDVLSLSADSLNAIENVQGDVTSIQGDVLRIETEVLGVSGALSTISVSSAPVDLTPVLESIDRVDTHVLGVSADVNAIDVSGLQVDIDRVNTNVLSLSADMLAGISLLSDDLKRTLGLMHENIFIDQPTYDSDGNLIGARVRIYSVAGSVGTASNVIGTYQITSTSSGPGKFTDWKQVRL
jgi:hypothetical protein